MSIYIQKQGGQETEARDARPEFLRPHEVAQKLGVSRNLVLRHLRSKRLPGFKLGKAWLVRASELDKYLSLKETLFAEQE